MRKNILLLLIPSLLLLMMANCKGSKKTATSNNKVQLLQDYNTFHITQYSNDSTYGHTEKNPIKVGGAKDNSGPLNERRFLNALMGPNGEPITYDRIGSCCPFKTKNAVFDNTGMLDKYRIFYKGAGEIVLYINMYDGDELQIPVGFKKKEF